ncbi:hypothetical protein [uncultured Hymenobacter sp.]|uniref:hypothetical protein n=1 Tax=uncultured Hymenobacter sp. TaxID=170016 RepID=UPI0035CA28C7
MKGLLFGAVLLLSSCAGQPGVTGRRNYYRTHPYPSAAPRTVHRDPSLPIPTPRGTDNH